MIQIEREKLEKVLEALHGFIPNLPLNDETQCGRYDKAITIIKDVLAQPKILMPNQKCWCGYVDKRARKETV